jgi:hypothetical protein
MWKKVAQALGAVHEESEAQILETEGVDRHSLEIVSVKGTTETICHLVGWVSITSQVNGRNENSQTKRLPPHENCYFDNNNWWIYTGSLPYSSSLLMKYQNNYRSQEMGKYLWRYLYSHPDLSPSPTPLFSLYPAHSFRSNSRLVTSPLAAHPSPGQL